MKNHDLMVVSDRDLVYLGYSLAERIEAVCASFFHKWRIKMILPAELVGDMKLFQRMATRHAQCRCDPFRKPIEEADPLWACACDACKHTEDEKKAVRRLAQWTLDEKCKLTGRPPIQVEWKD